MAGANLMVEDRILKWLKGEPVQFSGITYIFPHGQGIIRGYYKEYVAEYERIAKLLMGKS